MGAENEYCCVPRSLPPGREPGPSYQARTVRQESVWGVIFFEEHVEGLVSLERDSGGFGLGLFFSKRRVAAAIHSAES